jgi:hypothetical protein
MQVVGINTLSRIPSKIAFYLKLPDAESYTCHSMIGSSTLDWPMWVVILRPSNARVSSTVVEDYIEESVSNKIDIAKKIHGEVSRIEEKSIFVGNSSPNTFYVTEGCYN